MKNIKLLALLCVLGVFFVSCKDNTKSEWENFYGFTNEDVIGTYSFSNVSNAFDGVEGVGRFVCPDAEVNILASSQNAKMLRFTIHCPDEDDYSRTIEDYPTPNEDDFMLRMSTGYFHTGNKIRAYNVNAYVMKNKKQEIRVHGFSAMNTYKQVTDEVTGITTYVQIDGVYYYFDVIKN